MSGPYINRNAMVKSHISVALCSLMMTESIALRILPDPLRVQNRCLFIPALLVPTALSVDKTENPPLAAASNWSVVAQTMLTHSIETSSLYMEKTCLHSGPNADSNVVLDDRLDSPAAVVSARKCSNI
jgi:hypothetical protein